LPPGSICGHRRIESLSAGVSGCGVPPPEGTRIRPELMSDVNTIVPSSLHVPPLPAFTSHNVTGAPPWTATFFTLPPAKNASHWPSGEKKASLAPSVPDIGAASG
jgi:hypothetical protein